MRLISQRKLLVLSAAAILAAVAMVTLTPAAPPPKEPTKAQETTKAPASTRTLPTPIVIRGQGTAQPSDFTALKTTETKGPPAPKGGKLDVMTATPPAGLTPAEKGDLVKAVQAPLLKIYGGTHFPILDFTWQPLTLTPRTPWVDGKGNLHFSGNTGSGSLLVDFNVGLAPSLIRFYSDPNSNGAAYSGVDVSFQASQAGTYLITFHCFLSPTTMEVVTDGTTEGPTSSTFASGPAIVPILYIVSDLKKPWQHVGIRPSYNTDWYFFSVDIQYLPAMSGG